MKKLLVALLLVLSFTFVLKDNYETKIKELEQRIIALEQGDELLNETITKESEYFRISVLIEDGYLISMTTEALFDGEIETQYANEGEQEEPLYISNREDFIKEFESYLELLDEIYEALN